MLMNCKECDAQVSDQAENCPKCGAPIAQAARARQRDSQFFFVFFLIGCAGTVAWSFYGSMWAIGDLHWSLVAGLGDEGVVQRELGAMSFNTTQIGLTVGVAALTVGLLTGLLGQLLGSLGRR